MDSYYYLASPFNGTDKQKEYRYNVSRRVAAMLIKQDIHVFSPILHNHPIVSSFDGMSLPIIRATIMPLCLTFVRNAQGLLLLKLPGWQESKGVWQELAVSKKYNIPVYNLEPEKLESIVAGNNLIFSELNAQRI